MPCLAIAAFAATADRFLAFRGLTPTATCCRRIRGKSKTRHLRPSAAIFCCQQRPVLNQETLRVDVEMLADVGCFLDQLHSGVALLLHHVKLLLSNRRLNVVLNLCRLNGASRLSDPLDAWHDRTPIS